jgi:hypothetical protein
MSNLLTFPRHPSPQHQEPLVRVARHAAPFICDVGSAADVALHEHVYKKAFRDAMWKEHGVRIISKKDLDTIELHYSEPGDATAPESCRDHSHLLITGAATVPQVLP